MTRRKRSKWSAATTSTELAPGQMTANFWEKEVGKSRTALRRGIDNTPPEHVLARAKALAVNVLQPVRDHFGIPVSPGSWYRGEPLEKVITLAGFGTWCRDRKIPKDEDAWKIYFPLKSHPKGEAVDIEIAGVSNQELFDWIKENCEFDQLIMECGPDGWIHVSYREGDNRQEAFELPDG